MTLQPKSTYLLLFSLYWAQGLPVGFMTHALPVILRSQGISLAHIGGFGLLMAPWALKFLWAPYLDRRGHQDLRYYRAWILATQGLSIVVLVLLSMLPIQELSHPGYLLLFFISLLSINLLGATQDIATDAVAVNVLKPTQQHWGNLFQVIGSRLGFIVGGGLILWLMDLLTWQGTFLSLAVLVALNSIPILRTPLSRPSQQNAKNLQHHTVVSGQGIKQLLSNYWRYFTGQAELAYWLLVLISVKVTDGLSGPILKPMMLDIGLSFSQIGIYITMLGAGAALLGATLASCCLRYISRAQALMWFSILKLLSLAAFAWLAQQYQQGVVIEAWVIYVINALEDMFAAMLLLIMLTLVMQYSRQAHAGTDFSVQVALMAMVSGGLYSLSGIVADHLGYQDYLCLIVVIGLCLLLPIYLWQTRGQSHSH